MKFERVFLLSPAKIGGPRSRMLMREEAEFPLAVRLRTGAATIGEVYSFVSGLYFRGKLAYAEAFGAPPAGLPAAMVIVPGRGLLPINAALGHEQLLDIEKVPVESTHAAYRSPFLRDLALLDRQAGPNCTYILLGSIATEKYTSPLLQVFGDRLLFPEQFVGRGDMSRGGLMLRCARAAEELSYIQVNGATRRGNRPPKLAPVKNHPR
jgi:hypothetical protein